MTCHCCSDGFWNCYTPIYGLPLCSTWKCLSHMWHLVVKFGITGSVLFNINPSSSLSNVLLPSYMMPLSSILFILWINMNNKLPLVLLILFKLLLFQSPQRLGAMKGGSISSRMEHPPRHKMATFTRSVSLWLFTPTGRRGMKDLNWFLISSARMCLCLVYSSDCFLKKEGNKSRVRQ